MSFWFDPTLKKPTVSSTVQGNKSLEKYWQISVNNDALGTDFDSETVFEKSNYNNVLSGFKNNISNNKNNKSETCGIFDGCLNHSFSNAGVSNFSKIYAGDGFYLTGYDDIIENFKKNIEK